MSLSQFIPRFSRRADFKTIVVWSTAKFDIPFYLSGGKLEVEQAFARIKFSTKDHVYKAGLYGIPIKVNP